MPKVTVLSAAVLAALLSLATVAPTDDVILAYSGAETLICAPAGYRPKPAKTNCAELTHAQVKRWIAANRITQHLPATRISVSGGVQQIRLPSPSVAYLRRYSEDRLGDEPPPRRAAVLIIVRWTQEQPRTFGVQREQGGSAIARPYSRRVSAASENYFHASIEDMNPEKETVWRIRSNSRVYRVQFVAQ